jgi:hypothetical protein
LATDSVASAAAFTCGFFCGSYVSLQAASGAAVLTFYRLVRLASWAVIASYADTAGRVVTTQERFGDWLMTRYSTRRLAQENSGLKAP